MNIELIDEHRVLIDLCSDDMERLEIKYNTFRADNEEGRAALSRLIYIARQQTGFKITSERYSHLKAVRIFFPHWKNFMPAVP